MTGDGEFVIAFVDGEWWVLGNSRRNTGVLSSYAKTPNYVGALRIARLLNGEENE